MEKKTLKKQNYNKKQLTDFTVFALVTRQALAGVFVDSIDARRSISARIRAAFVLVDVAIGSVPIGLADAFVSSDLINASAVMARA